jgi:hypothetical protein
VGNPCVNGTAPTQSGGLYCNVATQGAQIDNFALARKNNITLRLDELNSGISTLLQTASAAAQSTVFSTPPQYRFAIYSMDSLWQIGLWMRARLLFSICLFKWMVKMQKDILDGNR